MVSNIYFVRENPSDFQVCSVVPFRCVTAVTHPAENNVIRVESVEPWATCPDGWHLSPVFYARMETT